MTNYNAEDVVLTLVSQFAELHVIYQITIIAISLFMVAMALTFTYNMGHLAITFISKTVKMVIELGEKMVKDLMKTLEKLLNVNPKPVEA